MKKGTGLAVSIAEIIIFIVVAILKGVFVLQNTGILSVETNAFLLVSVSWFLGVGTAMIELRFLDLLVHGLKRAFFIVAVWSAIEILTIVLTDGGKGFLSSLLAAGFACVCVFFGTTIIAIIVMVWQHNNYFPKGNNLLGGDDEIHTYTNLGTVHTPRSINAAIVAVQEDRIPMLGMNYGMILVMVIFKLIRTPFIYLMQVLYWATNNALVSIFIMGFMMECSEVSFGYAFFSALIVLFATEEISVRYKLCTDTTSCTNWGIMQYPDTWMMVCMGLLYLRIMFCAVENSVDPLTLLIFTVIYAVQGALLAPQVSVMLVGAIGCNTVLLFAMKTVDKALLLVLVDFVLVGITLLSARIGGGMFQSKKKIRTDIEGCGSSGGFSFAYHGICLKDVKKMDGDHIGNLVTTKCSHIVKSFFFILITLGSYGMKLFWQFSEWEFFVWFNLLVFWGGGFVLIYFISTNNGAGKTELSRFSAPAFVLSKVAWMMIVYSWLREGEIILGAAGILIAIYMAVNSIPFHVRWNKIYVNRNWRELLPVWFSPMESMKTGGGFYAADSKRNRNIIKKGTLKLESLEAVKNKTVYIYGTGEYGRRVYDAMRQYGITVKGFIDSDAEKWGGDCGETVIFSPQQIGRLKDDYLVVIGSDRQEGICGIYKMCSLYSLKNVTLYSL